MSAPSPSLVWHARLGWTRASYLLVSLLFASIVVIGIVWWPLLDDYVGSFDPRLAWWRQVDWLLLGVFGLMTVLIMARADVKRDLRTVAVGLMGGLVIESWGTQTGLWTYYTLERPPLWIIPAWPIASLAIDRLTGFLAPAATRLTRRTTGAVYAATFGVFAVLMLEFVRPAIGMSLTLAAMLLCAFLIATPVQARIALATFAAGAALGTFLELWGTTRGCWIYYTFETPPLFAVLAHGMAAVAFWRTGDALSRMARKAAGRGTILSNDVKVIEPIPRNPAVSPAMAPQGVAALPRLTLQLGGSRMAAPPGDVRRLALTALRCAAPRQRRSAKTVPGSPERLVAPPPGESRS